MVKEIERRTRNERRAAVVVGNAMMIAADIIVMMMTRQHLTPPLLFQIMNVRYYNNMNPNVPHHPQEGQVPVAQPHLANMASSTPPISTRHKSNHHLNDG